MRALSAALAALAVAGTVLLGWWGPQLARAHARDAASTTLDTATVALLGECQLVGAEATAMAREVSSYVQHYGELSELAAATAALRAAGRRPEFTFAVLDAKGRALQVAGAPAGKVAVLAQGGASCSDNQPGTYPASAPASGGQAGAGQASAGPAGVAGLGETYPVTAEAGGSAVAWAVAWAPLDDRALARFTRPGSALTLVGRNGVVLAGGDGADVVPHRVRSGANHGIEGGQAFAVTRPAEGFPYTLIATSDVNGVIALRALALTVLLIGLLGPLALFKLAGEQARGLSDELEQAGGELATGRRALDDTLDHFGAALENTHDLEGLLDTVVSACVHTAGSVAGLAMLIETDGHDQHDHQEHRTLLPLGSAANGTEASRAAAEELPALAEQYLAWSDSSSERTPLMSHRAATGPALAVPMTHGEKLVGVLVVAKGRGGRAFDALAPIRVRQIAEHAGTAVENVRAHEEVRRLSVTDPLTGVGNVRQLSTTLSREVAGALRFDRRLTVLMLDLDHFKRVNDTLGHQFGDVVLREFAHRLLGCVREMDTVARYGGEEFAIVLPETDVEGGRRVADRVLNEIRSRPIRQGDVEYAITVSIGVAGFPQHGRSVAEVLQSADAALYAAKKQGRDRWALADRPAGTPRVSQAG